MNLLPIALIGAATYLFTRQKGTSRPQVKGASYVAVFKLPAPATEEQLQSVMPPGANVQIDGDKAVVTFTAVNSQNISGFDSPIGRIQLLSVRRLSDVVGAITDLYKPAPVTFSGWYKRGGNYTWSGWTKPVTMSRAAVQDYMLNTSWEYAKAFRWDGKQWVKA